MREYRDVSKRADAGLPALFGTLPRNTYGVIPVPDYAAKSQTTPYYQPGSLKAGRPAYYFVNTYDLKMRPRWEVEALSLHEPGPPSAYGADEGILDRRGQQRAVRKAAARPQGGWAMPQYEFFCAKCDKTVSLVLTIGERERGDFKCPGCGSKTLQPQMADFFLEDVAQGLSRP